MRDFDYEYETLLNGSPVTVTLSVRYQWGEKFPDITLDSVHFDGVDVTPILDQKTCDALAMDAEHALHESTRD